MTPQLGLILSAIAFVGTHFLLSHPLRAPMIRAVGEGPFRGIYSLVAIVTFGAMIYFYREIGIQQPIWAPTTFVWIAGTLLMWFASILFVGSFMHNPALPGAKGPSGPPTAVFAITRHPMMWSFALWAIVHLAVVATPKAVILDTAILVLALGGAFGQDAKKRKLMGERWHEWTAQTAFVPLTRGLANPGAVALIGGTLLFVIATLAHPVSVGFWHWIR